MYACLCMYVYACACTLLRMCVYLCVCTYLCTYVFVYLHAASCICMRVHVVCGEGGLKERECLCACECQGVCVKTCVSVYAGLVHTCPCLCVVCDLPTYTHHTPIKRVNLLTNHHLHTHINIITNSWRTSPPSTRPRRRLLPSPSTGRHRSSSNSETAPMHAR